jgi:50S ribosomal protein L16 3-hydroxylase
MPHASNAPLRLDDPATLIAPLSVPEFIRRYWQKKPMLIRGNPERLQGLAAAFSGFDIEDLVKRGDLESSSVMGLRDGTPAPTLDVPTALAILDMGHQIYLRGGTIPEANDFPVRFARTLGKLRYNARGDFYLSKSKGGAQWHFDHNDNFTIQLRGKKKWWYSKHDPAVAPPGTSFDRPFAHLPEETRHHVPHTVQESRSSVTLKPGDVFYIPRGHWHRTDSSHSVSYNINLHATSWSEVVGNALARLLGHDEEWRQTAMAEPAAVEERLDRLKHAVAALRPADILASPERHRGIELSAEASVWRNPLSRWRAQPAERKGYVRIAVTSPDGIDSSFSTPRAMMHLIRRIPIPPDSMTVASLARAAAIPLDVATLVLEACVRTCLATAEQTSRPRAPGAARRPSRVPAARRREEESP